jgi:hypothetical protein
MYNGNGMDEDTNMGAVSVTPGMYRDTAFTPSYQTPLGPGQIYYLPSIQNIPCQPGIAQHERPPNSTTLAVQLPADTPNPAPLSNRQEIEYVEAGGRGSHEPAAHSWA